MTDDADYKKLLENALAISQVGLSSGIPSCPRIARPAVRKSRTSKMTHKVLSGQKLAKHVGATAWRTACSELGYLKKGEAFRRIPARNTAEYSKIKALQKAYESQAFR